MSLPPERGYARLGRHGIQRRLPATESLGTGGGGSTRRRDFARWPSVAVALLGLILVEGCREKPSAPPQAQQPAPPAVIVVPTPKPAPGPSPSTPSKQTVLNPDEVLFAPSGESAH